MYYPRFTKVIIDYFMTRKPSIPRQNRINWHYVRDDVLFSTIKVVSRHQTTQQYGAILPIEITTDDIRNSKAYKEYYACATGEAAPKPKASARKKKGDSASSTTPPTPTPTTTVVAAPRLSATAKGKQPARATTPTALTDVERTKAEQLKIVLKKSKQDTHISQQRGFGTDEGTGSRPGVPDVPSDDSEEELSWNSFDDEDVDEQTKEETRQEEEESFDPIPRTSEGSEDEGNDEEDQDLRLSEEAMIQEEEEADELYKDVNINQGRGLQLSQNIEDSHVTLTLVHPDGLQESSSVSSFVTSMLNPISDAGVESIFTMASSPIVSLQTPTPIMTPSTISTIQHLVMHQSLQQQFQAQFSKIFLPLTRCVDDQPIVQTSQHPEWFSQPRRPPSPDRDWNKTLPAAQGDAQSWISELARQTDARSSFNELLDTPIDFFNFIMNRLGVATLTPELLAGPTYELMRRSCNSLTELEYHLEEVYKETTNQLDWVNPEGQQHALWEVSHWGWKRQQFYGFAVNRESALDVYSKRRIIAVTELKIEHCHPEASGRSLTGS
nr:hypothetical protein [Tanacetum cinerariifolium]